MWVSTNLISTHSIYSRKNIHLVYILLLLLLSDKIIFSSIHTQQRCCYCCCSTESRAIRQTYSSLIHLHITQHTTRSSNYFFPLGWLAAITNWFAFLQVFPFCFVVVSVDVVTEWMNWLRCTWLFCGTNLIYEQAVSLIDDAGLSNKSQLLLRTMQ